MECKKCHHIKKWKDGTYRLLNYKIRITGGELYYSSFNRKIIVKMEFEFKDLDKWQVDYSEDCDELFIGIIPQPNGAKSFYVEGVQYVICRGKIVGMFIEYFKTQINSEKSMINKAFKLQGKIKLEKCIICGKPMKPDKKFLNYSTKKWDEHTYFPCDCVGKVNKNLRVSIG